MKKLWKAVKPYLTLKMLLIRRTIMDDKIIKILAERIKKGLLTIEQVPLEIREQVEKELGVA